MMHQGTVRVEDMEKDETPHCLTEILRSEKLQLFADDFLDSLFVIA